MDFELSEEQALLKATLGQYLAQRYDFAARTKATRTQPGYRADVWRDFADKLGLLSLAVPAGEGGLGGGGVAQMLVMEEIGRALVVEPIAETVFQGSWLLERCGLRHLRSGISDGSVRIAVAITEPDMRYDLVDVATRAVRTADGWALDGTKSVVMTAPWATHLIVAARTSGAAGESAGLSLFLVEANNEGVTQSPYPTLDGRRAADVAMAGAIVPPEALIGGEGSALPLLEELRDRAIAAQAAEASGLLDRLVSDTVAYAKQRQQFGQPIASFQALQHRMVDMHIQVELVRSAAVFAALKLDAAPDERALATSAAKVTVAQACRFVGQNAVQLHGGMGMTDELSIGHYFKRATVIENEFGTAGWHLARHARLSGHR